MLYFRNCLTREELAGLRRSVGSNYSPVSNNIRLQNGEPLIERLRAFIQQYTGVETVHLSTFVFLVCSTTMERFDANGGWHTDETCSFIDGTCFNAWIPIYVDSASTGLEVITRDDNPAFYEQLGDPTQPLLILSRQSAPQMFTLAGADADADLVAINRYSGNIVPFSTLRTNISRLREPVSGDLCLFRQTEIHRGFHADGVRIQLSLKFVARDAALNSKPSNPHYPLYSRLGGKPDILEFETFRSLFPSQKRLSKHGRLEAELVRALLSGNREAC